MQNYFENLNIDLSCPLPKNLTMTLKNATYDDRLFPPMGVERRWKISVESVGLVKKKKGWISMFALDVECRYRKFKRH
jgi:hypothetical protein